jgi:hypothetical protein
MDKLHTSMEQLKSKLIHKPELVAEVVRQGRELPDSEFSEVIPGPIGAG